MTCVCNVHMLTHKQIFFPVFFLPHCLLQACSTWVHVQSFLLLGWKYFTSLIPKSETQGSTIHLYTLYVCTSSASTIRILLLDRETLSTSWPVKIKAGIKDWPEPRREKCFVSSDSDKWLLVCWLVLPQCRTSLSVCSWRLWGFWPISLHDTCLRKQTVCLIPHHFTSNHRWHNQKTKSATEHVAVLCRFFFFCIIINYANVQNVC